ncbi:MAG TPA: hypothetical protein VGZ91_11110 [Candidatus Sulfotelmatobacter sp.]|jgi:hypothetical protein|nr:hypothetical protein [Candidatus Sulfotelmatobacter sp.]
MEISLFKLALAFVLAMLLINFAIAAIAIALAGARSLWIWLTAAAFKRILFSILVLWSFNDAIITVRHRPTLELKIDGFCESFAESMLFVGLIYMIWDWISRTRNRKAKT